MKLSDCNAVILCGGQGTRIRHLLPEGCPKIMANINRELFIDLLIEHLQKWKFHRLVFSAGYGAAILDEWLDFNMVRILKRCCFELIREKKRLGTAGAVAFALKTAWIDISDPFFVFNGDTYCDVDYAAMLDYHLKSKSVITVAHDDQMRHVGTFVASRRLIDLIPQTDGKYDMEELFTLLGKRHEPVGWFYTEAEFRDIGNEEGLREFRRFWAGQTADAVGSKGA